MMLLASAGGNRVPVIAQLVQADEDTVREVIHRFKDPAGRSRANPTACLRRTIPSSGWNLAGRDLEDEFETVLLIPLFSDLNEAEARDRGQGRHVVGADRCPHGRDCGFGRRLAKQLDQR